MVRNQLPAHILIFGNSSRNYKKKTCSSSFLKKKKTFPNVDELRSVRLGTEARSFAPERNSVTPELSRRIRDFGVSAGFRGGARCLPRGTRMLEGLEGAAGFEDSSPKEDKTGSECVCVRARARVGGWWVGNVGA